jgi:hypothetical protein
VAVGQLDVVIPVKLKKKARGNDPGVASLR